VVDLAAADLDVGVAAAEEHGNALRKSGSQVGRVIAVGLPEKPGGGRIQNRSEAGRKAPRGATGGSQGRDRHRHLAIDRRALASGDLARLHGSGELRSNLGRDHVEIAKAERLQ